VSDFWIGKTVLVTGGTGSIGGEIVRQLLDRNVRVVRIFSRDETKQFFLQHELRKHANVRYLIGDVRDRERVLRALEDVDVVCHAAALKHVPLCEYNPFEAAETNVRGTQNVLAAALDRDVDRVMVVSSDKAASPMNVVGATKLLCERLATAANYFRGRARTRIASVRFGNVVGSRGSLVPLVVRQIAAGGPLTVTDPGMTRFIISARQAVGLALSAVERMEGGEVFVMKGPTARIQDLVEVLLEHYAPLYGRAPRDIAVEFIGRRPGEKLAEVLLTEDEMPLAQEADDMFVIRQRIDIRLPEEPGFSGRAEAYSSAQQTALTKDEIRALLADAGLLPGPDGRLPAALGAMDRV
jgi:FlaA1/EpsC-like NDP-sugar epimerase